MRRRVSSNNPRKMLNEQERWTGLAVEVVSRAIKDLLTKANKKYVKEKISVLTNPTARSRWNFVLRDHSKALRWLRIHMWDPELKDHAYISILTQINKRTLLEKVKEIINSDKRTKIDVMSH